MSAPISSAERTRLRLAGYSVVNRLALIKAMRETFFAGTDDHDGTINPLTYAVQQVRDLEQSLEAEFGSEIVEQITTDTRCIGCGAPLTLKLTTPRSASICTECFGKRAAVAK